ncbi:SprT family protein [Lacticaseibacillus parakribbianus]|uniref:SprT family protein n=1 Tax=Lacticaseibacillus parakribbianus TaxID=2970927 RepID=UPI0021CB5C0B|nr:SprT family protein [Lacticaseibacillus parakribbianus]
MTEQELQALVENISQTWFHRPFVNRATFNRRLKTTGGRFMLASSDLEFNPALFAAADRTVQVGIIKHELCHYHLYRLHRGFRHQDADFKALLAAVAGLRYAPRLTPPSPPRYVYACTACGLRYPRQRRIDLRRLRCGRCGARLRLVSGPNPG